MAADLADAIEFLGRFGIFWTFVLKPSYRRTVINEWKDATGLVKVISLLDGIVTAVVGVLPFAIVGTALWWVS